MKKIMVQFNMPGVSLKQYDEAWKDVRAAGHSNPKGLIHHAGGIQGNNLIISDVWESEDAFKKFGETLMPILQKQGFPNVQPTIIPVHFAHAGVEAKLESKEF